MDGILKLIVSILIFVFVLVLTRITTVYIAKLQRSGMAGENITVIETQRLSNTKCLHIVKIGEEYFALASGKDSVTVISKLDSQGLKLPLEDPNEEEKKKFVPFANILEKFRNKQDKE